MENLPKIWQKLCPHHLFFEIAESLIIKGDSCYLAVIPSSFYVTPAGLITDEGFISVYGGFKTLVFISGDTFGYLISI